MELKYKIYSEKKILVEIISGVVTFEDFKKMFVTLSADKHFMEFDKVLSDLTKATLKVSVFASDTFLKFIKSIVNDREVKWGIITTNPKATALSMLVTIDPFFRKHTKIFSKLDACTSYLNVSFEESIYSDCSYLTIKNR